MYRANSLWVNALSNIFLNKVRSILSIIGILVGTGSVVALLTGGQLATDHALAQFKTLGTNLISVSMYTITSSTNANYFKASDVSKVMQANSNILNVSPYIILNGSMYYQGKQLNASLIGLTNSLISTLNLTLQKGRFISSYDVGSTYCMIGTDLAKHLRQKGSISLLGDQVQILNSYCTVVGILNSYKPNLFFFQNLNDSVMIPLINSYNISKYAHISNLLIRFKKGASVKRIEASISNTLKLLLPKKKEYFSSPDQILKIMSKQKNTFTLLLGLIGGISLLVGGIGVMNVMLMAVLERRQEIGIRMAVGATGSDIMRMILIEAMLQTLLGGLLGVGFGLLVSYIIATFSGWGFHWYLLPPLIGFSVSLIVGIIAGAYPAYKASKLNPINSLEGSF